MPNGELDQHTAAGQAEPGAAPYSISAVLALTTSLREAAANCTTAEAAASVVCDKLLSEPSFQGLLHSWQILKTQSFVTLPSELRDDLRKRRGDLGRTSSLRCVVRLAGDGTPREVRPIVEGFEAAPCLEAPLIRFGLRNGELSASVQFVAKSESVAVVIGRDAEGFREIVIASAISAGNVFIVKGRASVRFSRDQAEHLVLIALALRLIFGRFRQRETFDLPGTRPAAKKSRRSAGDDLKTLEEILRLHSLIHNLERQRRPATAGIAPAAVPVVVAGPVEKTEPAGDELIPHVEEPGPIRRLGGTDNATSQVDYSKISSDLPKLVGTYVLIVSDDATIRLQLAKSFF